MKQKNNYILSEMKISSALMKLSLPATIAMLVNALYNIIDTIFVGRFVGNMGIAGLAISFPLQMLALGISSMFGMGAASLASRQLGAQEHEKANKTVSTMVFFNAVTIIFLSALCLVFIKPVLTVFGATDAIYPYSYDYMKIILPSFIFFGFGVSLNNIVRAEGNSKTAMFSMLIGAIGNIILDYVFMGILDMGIEGAAIATMISQICSSLYLIYYFFVSRKSHFKIKIKNIEFKFKKVNDIVSIGFSSFLTQAGTSLLTIVINKSLVFYGGANGEIAIAIYGIINKVTSFLIMPEIGIRQGTQPILGFAYGNKNYKRVNDTIKTSLKFMFSYSIITYVLVMLFSGPIISLFGGDVELIELGTPALRIVLASIFIAPLQIQASCVFQSVGKAMMALITSMLRQFICLIPLVLIIPYFTRSGLFGIWIAFPIADALSSIISGIMIKKEFDSYKKKFDSKIEIVTETLG